MLYCSMELICSDGTVFGARYHTVRPVFPAHAPTWFKPEWDIMVEWCVEKYGPSPSLFEPPPGRWYVNNSRFWFRNEEDLTLFLLRWI
jgi:hypothetical protein